MTVARLSAAETTIGEAKSTITDAGPSRGPILRSETPELVKQEIWAWLAATQLLRRAAHTVEIDIAVLTARDVACQLDVIRHRPDFVRHATAFLAALNRSTERAFVGAPRRWINHVRKLQY